jgi:hypothetical protein
VLSFFQQWFGVYQHRSGHPGEFWSLADTLAGFERCLKVGAA